MSRLNSVITPGMRVLCRDAEWLVTRTEALDPSGAAQVVYCTGVDAMVRDQAAAFLTDLDDITPIDPKDTRLVRDTSHGFRRAKLFLEAQLRQMPLTAAHPDLDRIGAFQPLPFQVKTVEKALRQMRPRLLLADAVGLGKTIQVGMVLAELIRRGRAARILVLAKKSMLTQFQAELWNRFAIPLVRLDSTGLARLRLRIPASKNPFEVYHRIIISMDTLKDVGRYRHFLENTRWDVVVIDEAHNVAGATNLERNYSHRLARLLSRKADSMILTTATPHNGRRETFGRLISLLDPSAIPDPTYRQYVPEDIAPFFLMRFKEDVRAEAGGSFADRVVIPLAQTSAAASPAEEAAYAALATLRGKKDADRTAVLRWGLYKSFLSSPEACLSTIEKSLAEARRRSADAEAEALSGVRTVLSGLTLAHATRFQLLVRELRAIGWTGQPDSPRMLLFTESRVTQLHLARALAQEFHFSWNEAQEKQPEQVMAVMHGNMADVCLTRVVEAFGTGSAPVRLLVATDVASEGVNLHHQCWHIIHYDLPWSIITLIQRNGRIDRYGQLRQPQVRYLMVRTSRGELRGDADLFERLIEKVEEINRTTRSGESVLRLYDADAETEFVAENGLIARNHAIFDQPAPSSDAASEPASLEALLRQATEAAMDDLAGLFDDEPEPAPPQTGTTTPAPVSTADASRIRLYGDPDFLRDGYRLLAEESTTETYQPIVETAAQILLTPPPNLQRRLGLTRSGGVVFGATAIPEEAWPKDNRFHLTTDPARVDTAIRAARALSGQWSEEQLLTELHPIMRWLAERLMTLMPRGEAPLIASPALAPGEMCFCFIGQVSSRAGTPLIVDAHAVTLARGGSLSVLPLHDALRKAGFHDLAETGKHGDIGESGLAALVAMAVGASLDHLRDCRRRRQDEVRPLLAREEARLNQWLAARREHIRPILAEAAPGSRTEIAARKQLDEAEQFVTERALHWKHAHFEAADHPTTRLILAIEGVR